VLRRRQQHTLRPLYTSEVAGGDGVRQG
jgi:hypothetical protein